MAKSMLGIDIGYNRLKLALVVGGNVKKTAVADMPEKMVQQGRVVSVEAMGELIRDTMKENGIRCSSAAVVLSDESVFVRNVTMPVMSADQLVYNLPYEFRDYITDELNKYLYDYAMQTEADVLQERARRKNEGGNADAGEDAEDANTMDLIAVAAPKELIEDIRVMTRKAGMRLEMAAPSVSALTNIMRQFKNAEEESCILDLGYHTIRLHMFKGEKHEVTRELETGLSALDDIIADNYNVDVHLAHTYLVTDHDGCQNSDLCRNAYANIAVELMRAVNFYRFSNPDSRLENLYICGGGSLITPLVEEIGRTLDLKLHTASSLIQGKELQSDSESSIMAIGIAMNC